MKITLRQLFDYRGFVVAFCLMTLVSACHLFDKTAKPTAQPKQTAALEAAGASTAAANTKANATAVLVDAKAVERDSNVKANVGAALDWNALNPEGNPKFGVDEELKLAVATFADVPDSPTAIAAAASRRALVEAGKAQEARTAYDKATTDAKGLVDQIATLRTQKEQSDKERDTAIANEKTVRATFEAQLKQNLADNQAKIDKALDEARNGVFKQQAKWLNIGGAACLLIFAVSLWVASMSGNILGGAKSAWIFPVMAIMCFGLAQIVSQPWFKWAVLGAAFVGTGITVWWVIKHLKDKTLKDAAEAKATAVTSVLKNVVPVLDTAYTTATTEVKKVMDDTIFDPLNKNMDAADKAAVHEVRASIEVAPTPTPTP